MPTYEYECESGHRYEKREGFDAPATQKCPTCKKTARRVLFAPPIVFKGSGFYKTDSRGSEAAGSSSSESSSDESSKSRDDAKTPAASASSNDHGHSHGPGGHTHDAPAKDASTPDKAVTPS